MQPEEDSALQSEQASKPKKDMTISCGISLIIYCLSLCAGFTEADASDVLHIWHKGMGYAKGEVDNFPVELLFRLATTADIKQVSKQKHQVCI